VHLSIVVRSERRSKSGGARERWSERKFLHVMGEGWTSRMRHKASPPVSTSNCCGCGRTFKRQKHAAPLNGLQPMPSGRADVEFVIEADEFLFSADALACSRECRSAASTCEPEATFQRSPLQPSLIDITL
jgi:hypothetical protein